MKRQLSTFPLSPKQLAILKNGGFVVDDDVIELTPTQLKEELGITLNEALGILRVIKGDDQTPLVEKSAYDLLQEEEGETSIVTFCAALDQMIGGGIPLSKITEFCGAPGMGKTQFGMQVAVDAIIPEMFGGVGGEAVYIDCEGSFICERLLEIAKAALHHIRTIAEADSQDGVNEALSLFTLKHILKGIHVFRCHDYVQLLALSHTLPDFLKENGKIKVIILDSIAFHFRHDFQDMALRTRLLHGLVQSFMKMACDHTLAVVIMNQMTTKISEDEHSKLVPALGTSWGHACTIRIILQTIGGKRYAHLLKSPSMQESTVQFDITKDGIRDAQQYGLDDTSSQPEERCSSNLDIKEMEQPSSKRWRKEL